MRLDRTLLAGQGAALQGMPVMAEQLWGLIAATKLTAHDRARSWIALPVSIGLPLPGLTFMRGAICSPLRLAFINRVPATRPDAGDQTRQKCDSGQHRQGQEVTHETRLHRQAAIRGG